jgi:hypothetical protein
MVKSVTISEIQHSDEHILIKAMLGSINSDCALDEEYLCHPTMTGSNGLLL